MSTDGGTVWTQKDSYYGDGGCIIVHPESANVIITGGQGPSTQTNWSFVVSHTRNSGATWTRCNLSGADRGWCYALAVAPSAPAVVYAGGFAVSSGAVYRSSDRGVSWQQTAAPSDTVYGLAVMPADANRVIAATHSGAFLTTDGGASWSSIGGGSRLRAIAVHPFGPETLCVAGDQGVMISRDAGANWTAMNQGLEIPAVACLGFAGDDGSQLIAGTAGRGCYVWPFASGIAESERPQATSHKPLATIARGVLQIGPQRAASGSRLTANGLRLGLYDINGSNVLGLQPGANDVSGLAPGVYFVRGRGFGVSGQGEPAVQKVVITR